MINLYLTWLWLWLFWRVYLLWFYNMYLHGYQCEKNYWNTFIDCFEINFRQKSLKRKKGILEHLTKFGRVFNICEIFNNKKYIKIDRNRIFTVTWIGQFDTKMIYIYSEDNVFVSWPWPSRHRSFKRRPPVRSLAF